MTIFNLMCGDKQSRCREWCRSPFILFSPIVLLFLNSFSNNPTLALLLFITASLHCEGQCSYRLLLYHVPALGNPLIASLRTTAMLFRFSSLFIYYCRLFKSNMTINYFFIGIVCFIVEDFPLIHFLLLLHVFLAIESDEIIFLVPYLLWAVYQGRTVC